jgi:hypothetical protein
MPDARQRVNAFFTDTDRYTAAVRELVTAGRRPACYLPYPLHGFDAALGLKRSWLGRPVLAAILLGCAVALAGTWFIQTQDYPTNIGGKPFFTWSTVAVVVLETGLLLGALATKGLVFHTARLLPDADTRLLDDRMSDDLFCVVVADLDATEAESLATRLREQGAERAEVVHG